MQEPVLIEEFQMGLDDRVKSLETITTRLDGSVGELVKDLKSLSKAVTESNKPHWAVPILVGLVLAWIGWLSLQVISHGNKLTAIGAMLSPQETLKGLTSALSPDPQKAKKELAQVASSFRQLNQAKVNLPVRTLDETTEELTKISVSHQDLPETWAAIGEFINYRSLNSTSWIPPADLPDCMDTVPRTATLHRPFTAEGKQQELKANFAGYVNCRITLDSPDDGKRLSSLLSSGNIAHISFNKCVVAYHGGAITIALSWDKHVVDSVPIGKGAVTLTAPRDTLDFVDCVLDISIQRSLPPPDGQNLARLLLAKNTSTFELPLR
jgi:hypothetical protein